MNKLEKCVKIRLKNLEKCATAQKGSGKQRICGLEIRRGYLEERETFSGWNVADASWRSAGMAGAVMDSGMPVQRFLIDYTERIPYLSAF